MSTRLLLVSARYHHFKLSKRPHGTKFFGTKRQFIGTSGYVLWVFLCDCDASPLQLGDSGFACLSQESHRIGERPRKRSRTLKASLHGGGGPQIGEVTCDGSPHLSCKREQVKMRDYMDSRVTPPKRVTAPTWGSPTFATCKQALKVVFRVKTTLMSLGCNIPRNAMPFDKLNHRNGLLTIR